MDQRRPVPRARPTTPAVDTAPQGRIVRIAASLVDVNAEYRIGDQRTVCVLPGDAKRTDHVVRRPWREIEPGMNRRPLTRARSKRLMARSTRHRVVAGELFIPKQHLVQQSFGLGDRILRRNRWGWKLGGSANRDTAKHRNPPRAAPAHQRHSPGSRQHSPCSRASCASRCDRAMKVPMLIQRHDRSPLIHSGFPFSRVSRLRHARAAEATKPVPEWRPQRPGPPPITSIDGPTSARIAKLAAPRQSACDQQSLQPRLTRRNPNVLHDGFFAAAPKQSEDRLAENPQQPGRSVAIAVRFDGHVSRLSGWNDSEGKHSA